MARSARESDRIHHVAFTFRYTYCLAELRRRVRAGEIGRPFYIRVRGEGWGDLRPEARVEWRHGKSLAGSCGREVIRWDTSALIGPLLRAEK